MEECRAETVALYCESKVVNDLGTRIAQTDIALLTSGQQP